MTAAEPDIIALIEQRGWMLHQVNSKTGFRVELHTGKSVFAAHHAESEAQAIRGAWEAANYGTSQQEGNV